MPFGYKEDEKYKPSESTKERRATMGGLSRFEQASKAKEQNRILARTKDQPPSVTKQNPWTQPLAKGVLTPQGFTSQGGYTPTVTGRSGSFPTQTGRETKFTFPDLGKKDEDEDLVDEDKGDDEKVDDEKVDDEKVDDEKVDDETVDEDIGDGTPSLTTITKPDETPDLQALTNDMDLRNMITNVLNKNNPLFKQARTRAFQAMAARGIVNSSMAEEAVTLAMLNVAIPIAQRVINDLQEVMKANVNRSNEFKAALNQMYYTELLHRIDAANAWNLERMSSQQANWQAILGAKIQGLGIKDDPQFDRYMSMLSKLGTAPKVNVAG